MTHQKHHNLYFLFWQGHRNKNTGAPDEKHQHRYGVFLSPDPRPDRSGFSCRGKLRGTYPMTVLGKDYRYISSISHRRGNSSGTLRTLILGISGAMSSPLVTTPAKQTRPTCDPFPSDCVNDIPIISPRPINNAYEQPMANDMSSETSLAMWLPQANSLNIFSSSLHNECPICARLFVSLLPALTP